ncbi:hypothetical protein CERZMDRAFT_99907 [Cercospora zeae-maydis SCOH1-5]|uniref:Uncharacterized protein n=1 Tax=Cercospora zeae-maydis SCOH1-5 TaxID=717836 RepID=A0A6A6F8X8_9PEZI|nr:hypothetical protein CERZMDRAFT_99907 [Cercospora zeae-maydis SCOH1-5]
MTINRPQRALCNPKPKHPLRSTEDWEYMLNETVIADNSSNRFTFALTARVVANEDFKSRREFSIDFHLTAQGPDVPSQIAPSTSSEQSPRSGYLTATLVDITPENSPGKTELLLPGPNTRPQDHHSSTEPSHAG